MLPTFCRHHNALSLLTLALLVDSGWYVADYSEAMPCAWGEGKGCAFVSQPCLSTPAFSRPVSNAATSEFRASISPVVLPGAEDTFCTSAGALACTPDRLGVGRCNAVDWGTAITPSTFQYWGSASPGFGGLQTSADYCPYFQLSTDCRSTCGPSCRCLEGHSGISPAVGCYDITCDYSSKVVGIQVLVLIIDGFHSTTPMSRILEIFLP